MISLAGASAGMPVGMSVGVVLVAVLAGGLGAVARFVVDGAIRSWAGTRSDVGSGGWWGWLPWATTVINTSGSFVLGLLVGLVHSGGLAGAAEVVAGTGFLGGYTTFSTASFEVVRLLQEHRRWGAAAHALVMLVLGLLAAGIGLWAGLRCGAVLC